MSDHASFIDVVARLLYIPGGRRIEGRDYGRGAEWVCTMIDAISRDDCSVDKKRIFDVSRLAVDEFNQLVLQLKSYGLEGSEYVTEEEKVVMFLVITCQNMSYRMAREMFQVSTRTINRAFHEVLGILVGLMYSRYVLKPDEKLSDVIFDNPKFYSYFDNCIGALDGTHIPIAVPRGELGIGHVVYRNRKGDLT
jgi:hypothetical protein